MSTLVPPYNTVYPASYPQGYPPVPPDGCTTRCLNPKTPETWNYGFRRLVPLLQSPPVGAGILAITFFFFIVFFSNVLLESVSCATLGISVTLSTFGLLALVLLVLFIL
ncbi:hypothetical protein [Desulfosporosinus sp. Sb-LF]|uniref:hypothetical protein n=1 Tax=Desulfosporosinus sp. Sb-LF TaxID=2560027 RepID=UPI0018EE82EC|nr:hypothetical protein [Desulfosporosinus sp. Sb-LF]